MFNFYLRWERHFLGSEWVLSFLQRLGFSIAIIELFNANDMVDNLNVFLLWAVWLDIRYGIYRGLMVSGIAMAASNCDALLWWLSGPR